MADEPEPTHGSSAEGATPAVGIRVPRAGGSAGIRRGRCVESPDPAPWRPLVERVRDEGESVRPAPRGGSDG